MSRHGGSITAGRAGAPLSRRARPRAPFALCGDFGEDGRRRVIDAVDGELPVGYVTYLPEEAVWVDKLFA